MGENGEASGVAKKPRFRAYWLFVLSALVLVILNEFLGPAIAERLQVSWSWPQFAYALISVEVSAAIYFYGVGSLSPHWRPETSSGVSGTKATLLAGKPAGGSHPLGPRMREPVRPASSEAGATQTIAVQALVEKKPDGGKPRS